MADLTLENRLLKIAPASQMQNAVVESPEQIRRLKSTSKLKIKKAEFAIPQITPLSGTTFKPRIMFDYNPTLVCFANLKWKGPDEPDANGEYQYVPNFDPHRYMLECGFEPSFIVSNGTFNRATWWWNLETKSWRPVTKVLNRYGLDASAYEDNFSNPIKPEITDALVALAKNAGRFWPEIKPFRSIWTDIEGTEIYNLFSYKQVTSTESLRVVKAWLESAIRFRSWSNLTPSMDLFTYGGHLMGYMEHLFQESDKSVLNQVIELEREHARQYSGFTGCAYNWDMPWANGGDSWTQGVDWQQRILNLYYPQFRDNKWMYITPTWQIYWDSEGRKYHDTPIPLELWKSQINYLATRGWNIFVWLGTTWNLPLVKKYIDYLLRFKP